MRQNRRSFDHPAWRLATGVGFILFLLIQVFPIAGDSDAGGGRILSRREAEQAALSAAKERFGLTPDRTDIVLTHLSDSEAVGYLSKKKLFERYNRLWADNHPTDVYRADVRLPDREGGLTLFLHMETGQLIGWMDNGPEPANAARAAASSGTDAASALKYAALWGKRPEDWKWNGEPADEAGRWTFVSVKESLGEARLMLKVRVPSSADRPDSTAIPPWSGGSVTYEIQVPEAFAAYMAEQIDLASRMNAYGFILPEIVFLILAIVYAASLRKFTSFRRGLFLSAVFLLLYTVFYLNMRPGFRAGLLEEGTAADSAAVNALLIVNLFVIGCMAVYAYFAAVAGDGLWRSMDRPLWPRWRDAGFGRGVLSGMKTGYALAFLLLGVQSVILVGLERGIGMFQASDATQSLPNMTLSWLLLALAWCAGISEELQSRLFGVALFRNWLLSGTRRLLGRAPSARAATALTVLAMLPPGLIWAFGHVSYAVYPAYSRLIELIILALLFGWFLLRFGLFAVLFAHIILDSTLMGVQMMFDSYPGDEIMGLAGIALPAVVAVVIAWAHRIWGGRRSDKAESFL